MRDIPGYEGEYAITSCGRVWSYKRQRFLKPYDNGNGYLLIALSHNGEVKRYLVHRLVAEVYIPNPLGLPQVNHKNEIKQDNYVNNLEWVTSKENNNYGTRNERARKNISKPVYCVELDRVFESLMAASAELDICYSAISNCLTGRSFTAGKYHWEYVEKS